MQSWFIELSAIDVSKHVKTKNGLRYLSWMWAWIELKKRYPLSYSTVHETEDGMLVWKDPVGCHVKTSITIVWEEDGELKDHTVTEYLPCMDFKNKAIPYENVDAMVVNKTIQRSLTKCIARLGIGSYLFVNEDLPEEVGEVKEIKEAIKAIVSKKVVLSDKAKGKVAELCKEAEEKANPDLDKELICGNYANIDDLEILRNLKKNLMAIRK